MMNFFKNPCNFYFTLWTLYNLKGALYAEGTIINQFIMLLIICISVKESLQVVKFKNYDCAATFFKGLNKEVFLFLTYGIILILTNGLVAKDCGGTPRPTYYYLEGALIGFLPIYTCFLYSKKGYLRESNLKIWVITFLIVSVLEFQYEQTQIIASILEKGLSADGFTNNAGYIVLSVMPALYIFRKRPIIIYIGLGICTFFVVMSMKRGAIVLASISLVLILLHLLKGNNRKSKFSVVVLSILGLFALYYFINKMMTNDYFIQRLTDTLEGNSSNRDVVYNDIWTYYWEKMDLFQKSIGMGGMGTVLNLGMYAHNDWLEILVSQGVLGLVVFLYFMSCFYKSTRNNCLNSESRFCLTLIFIIFGIKTLFSMSIGIGSIPIFSSTMIGYALANGFSNEK